MSRDEQYRHVFVVCPNAICILNEKTGSAARSFFLPARATMTTPTRTLAIVYSDEFTVECDVGNSDSFEQLFRLAVDALSPWYGAVAIAIFVVFSFHSSF
jgi:hypothetical protein